MGHDGRMPELPIYRPLLSRSFHTASESDSWTLSIHIVPSIVGSDFGHMSESIYYLLAFTGCIVGLIPKWQTLTKLPIYRTLSQGGATHRPNLKLNFQLFPHCIGCVTLFTVSVACVSKTHILYDLGIALLFDPIFECSSLLVSLMLRSLCHVQPVCNSGWFSWKLNNWTAAAPTSASPPLLQQTPKLPQIHLNQFSEEKNQKPISISMIPTLLNHSRCGVLVPILVTRWCYLHWL